MSNSLFGLVGVDVDVDLVSFRDCSRFSLASPLLSAPASLKPAHSQLWCKCLRRERRRKEEREAVGRWLWPPPLVCVRCALVASLTSLLFVWAPGSQTVCLIYDVNVMRAFPGGGKMAMAAPSGTLAALLSIMLIRVIITSSVCSIAGGKMAMAAPSGKSMFPLAPLVAP